MIGQLNREFANRQVVVVLALGVSVAVCGQPVVVGPWVATWMRGLEHGVHRLRRTAPRMERIRIRAADKDGRQKALRELARGWNGDPHTLVILKAFAQSDENGILRRHAVAGLE